MCDVIFHQLILAADKHFNVENTILLPVNHMSFL